MSQGSSGGDGAYAQHEQPTSVAGFAGVFTVQMGSEV